MVAAGGQPLDAAVGRSVGRPGWVRRGALSAPRAAAAAAPRGQAQRLKWRPEGSAGAARDAGARGEVAGWEGRGGGRSARARAGPPAKAFPRRAPQRSAAPRALQRLRGARHDTGGAARVERGRAAQGAPAASRSSPVVPC